MNNQQSFENFLQVFLNPENFFFSVNYCFFNESAVSAILTCNRGVGNGAIVQPPQVLG